MVSLLDRLFIRCFGPCPPTLAWVGLHREDWVELEEKWAPGYHRKPFVEGRSEYHWGPDGTWPSIHFGSLWSAEKGGILIKKIPLDKPIPIATRRGSVSVTFWFDDVAWEHLRNAREIEVER